jgi:hypothetical protein
LPIAAEIDRLRLKVFRINKMLFSIVTIIFTLLFSCIISVSTSTCTFCTLNQNGEAVTFDFSSLSNVTYEADGVGPYNEKYTVTQPCGQATSVSCGAQNDPMLQECLGVGNLGNISIVLTSTGVDVTLHGGFNNPPMPNGRNAVYVFVCDPTVPLNNPPLYNNITESPPGFYNVVWHTPAACGVVSGTVCGPNPPVPPPVPPPTPCTPGSETCLPTWLPTWHMKNSTVLYTCNNTGMHNVTVANQYGIVVYDWSNAKDVWANAHPMSSEELITAQAEMVYAADPGLVGYAPRVWAYRNTIKALNWYTSVREKLDDPAYVSWFIKFKDFSNTPYPGGQGQAQNGSYHVPTCDWYDNGTAPRCSGFYHDQEQTPEHPGGGAPYPVDGECITQCDCGTVNPCGEYIFDHRGGEVNGQTFRDWFISEYMISNETLLHKNPITGEPQAIGLGWLDDSMEMNGPTEEDPNYIADTGASTQDMQEQVDAYQESMNALIETVIPMGGFFWQLMDGSGAHLNSGINTTVDPTTCETYLRSVCVPNPSIFKRFMLYNIPNGGKGASTQSFTDYTAEFLLTRGPYALLGYSWAGCTNGDEVWPRAAEWDQDFGSPIDASCFETSTAGVFTRTWSLATVTWNCTAGHGVITRT